MNDPRMKPVVEERGRLDQRGRDLLEQKAKLEASKTPSETNTEDTDRRLEAVNQELTKNTQAVEQNQREMVDLGVRIDEEAAPVAPPAAAR